MSEREDFSFLKLVVNSDNKIYRNEGILQHLVHLTVNEEHCSSLMVFLPNIVEDVISIIRSDKSLCCVAAEILLNLSGFSEGAYFVVTSKFESSEPNEEIALIRLLLEWTLEPTSIVADITCKILANVTRVEDIAVKIAEFLILNVEIVNTMIDVITDETYNSKGQTLDYMSHVVGNLTQAYAFRRFLIQSNDSCLNRLMSVIRKRQPSDRKEGVISIMRNCCFDTESHSELLGPRFNILPNLLYPLAGSEYIDYDLYNNVPIDLQYLPTFKQREQNPNSRKKLIESIYQLSATQFGRRFLRDCDTYIILKHYYNWEVDEINKEICEGVIGLLIRTEDEIGVDNVKEMANQFSKLDIT